MDEHQNQSQQADSPQPDVTHAAMPHGGKPGGSKKLVLIVIGVLVVGVILALVLQGSNNKNSNTNKSPQTTAAKPQTIGSVEITSSGFVPATIKIKAGSQITWTNNDSGPHHVVSDSNLPDLDSNVLNPKDTFGLTFDKAGTYTYHDQQNNGAFKGIVIVE
jgi:plastocyanin